MCLITSWSIIRELNAPKEIGVELKGKLKDVIFKVTKYVQEWEQCVIWAKQLVLHIEQYLNASNRSGMANEADKYKDEHLNPDNNATYDQISTINLGELGSALNGLFTSYLRNTLGIYLVNIFQSFPIIFVMFSI